MDMMNEEKEMTADDYTSQSLHAALDACLAEDSEGHEKAKKMAKLIKAMHSGKEDEEKDEPKEAENAPADDTPEAETEKKDADKAMEKEEERKEQAFGFARMEQTVPFTKPRIDREKGIIYDVHIAGMESRTDGARYRISAHEKAAPRFEQMAVGLDHNYASGPMKISEAWGVLRDPYMKADGPYARELHYLKTHERTEQILEDAERGTGIFSLSMVAKTKDGSKDISEYIPSRVDLVVRGATTRTLFNQEHDAAPSVTKADHDALALRFEQLKDEVAELKKRLAVREKVITPAMRLEQEVKTITATASEAFDLRAFWDKSLPVSK